MDELRDESGVTASREAACECAASGGGEAAAVDAAAASDGDALEPAATMALAVAYRGAAFSGFARQKDPALLTVQGSLEQALSLLYRREVPTVCAGRTDAGVHARGQVVSFDLAADELDARADAALVRSLNALTHEDIVVRGVCRKPAGFSARFDAKEREYRYFLSTGDTPALFMRDFSWHTGCLDVAAMQEASCCLVGEHDFKSFCVTSSAVGKSTNRCVNEISFAQREVAGEPLVVMTVKGNAFLHSMVRTMVGTLVTVGKGKRDADWVARALAACDRAAAGETAPAQGLVLWRVVY